MGAANGNDRLHGLDAVRGYALMLGIVYHATMSFLPGPQIWVVRDTHQSLFLSGLFFVSHMFRMTTFFLIAGFFGHIVVEKRGVKAFVKDRAKRIALPLVVGWPILFAAIVGATIYGAYVSSGHMPTAAEHAAAVAHGPRPSPLAFPLTHLWFLYLLLWLYAATLGLRALVLRLDTHGRFRAKADAILATIVESRFAPAALALPGALAMAFTGFGLEWFGIQTPDSSLLPNIPALVAYFTAFGFGWLLHRQSGLMNIWARRWPFHLVLAIALTADCLRMVGAIPHVAPSPIGPQRLLYSAVYSLATWNWTLAVIGLALKHLSNESPVRRYIADSSYWLYLIHLPIVMVLQAMVAKLNLPAEVKILIVLGVALPLMFASYQLMVRRTFIGAILNGRRAVPKTKKGSVKSAPRLAQPEPAE
ncbi:acyltransferase family protein [Phenylobacterium sp.]|jgi:peptidoglycan/LPS O-acetylase OafA/YrhL|uniref:acyltransferase family protein n=1 Tax=Phenylobacterium sp. TaxID=1871053 RepID=UPI002E2FF3B0|nr:acyltransferase family protein [Phenylobacterium sp.]HEX3366816.1 acyltransferase family protein [Phenylobacterium sp.]